MPVFPPVLERELRVAARRAGTFWTRVAMAGVATLVGGWILVTSQINSFTNPAYISKGLFVTLSGLAFVYCLLIGVRNTADCISSEKREGTLGLLFLTDLRGYDVVLGKMLATSLSSFYCLLGIFPVMAIPLIMGGVPPEVFWEMTAFLINIMLFSLAVGVGVSVLGRSERGNLGWTFLMIFFFTGGIPFLGLLGTEAWVRLTSVHRVNEIFSQAPPMWTLWPSPVFAFVNLMEGLDKRATSLDFWWSMLTIHMSAWLFLALASVRLPASWQDRTASAGWMRWREHFSRWRHGSRQSRAAFRRSLLDRNAFFWLAARNRLKPFLVWILLAATGLCWIWGRAEWPADFDSEAMSILVGIWLNYVFKFWMISESSHRIAEDRRSGALELLLSTPLSIREILRGQFLALRRQFLWPGVAVLGVCIVFAMRYASNNEEWFYTWIAGSILFAADAITIAWAGAWHGLKMRTATKAMMATMTRVIILPWVVLGSGVAVMAVVMSLTRTVGTNFGGGDQTGITVWLLVALGVDAVCLFRARANLLNRFRETATQRFDAKRPPWWRRFGPAAKPPPLPAS